MRQLPVRFTPNADEDFDSILHFIAADNPIRALSFVDELRDAAIERLGNWPMSAPAVSDKARYLVIGRYIVAYRVNEAPREVEVLMIAEGHRDWRRLLDDRD